MKNMAYFRDSPLHNEKVRVVYIKLNTLEERLNNMLLGLVAVQEILGNVGQGDLRANS